MACATCSGVCVGGCLGRVDRSWAQAGLVASVALPPLVEPAFRAGQVPTDVLDLVVGKIVVEGLVTTVCCALRHGRCLSQLRCVLLSSGVCSRCLGTRAGDVRSCFQALMRARRCTRNAWRRAAPGPAGAGVGVASRGWLRDNALDAQERSQTQWGATVSSVGDQGHPMAVQ